MSVVTADLLDRLRTASPEVTVAGDLVLDGWWTGTVDRVTREAPAPVVDVAERSYAPGGAANTAVNLAALGARVRLVGLVGDDADGRRLLDLLVAGGVDTSGVVVSPRVRTTAKNRILAADQVLVRVDEQQSEPYPTDVLEDVARAVRDAAGRAVLVVCDYGVGVLEGPVRTALLSAAARAPLTVVDAHDLRRWADLRPDLVTPNAGEVAALVGVPHLAARETDRAAAVVAHADAVLAASGAAAAVVTLDSAGTVLVAPGEEPHRTQAEPATEKQASGAGDTFVAALTLARAAGLPLPACQEVAQAAADVVVQRFGTSVCDVADLATRLAARTGAHPAGGAGTGPVLPPDELLARLDADRRAGRRIVFTNGCFDVLHRGHTTYLEQARRLGDVLVVALNDDDSVRRLKGPERPINAAEDRAAVIAALACVDYVTVFGTDTPIPLIERIRPDVYAKGGDYTPEMLAEAEAVRAYGGELRMLDYVAHHSTTAMVERIRWDVPQPAERAAGAS